MTINKAERLPNLKELTIEAEETGEGLYGAPDLPLKKCEEVGVDFNLTTKVTQWIRSWTMIEGFRERRRRDVDIY